MEVYLSPAILGKIVPPRVAVVLGENNASMEGVVSKKHPSLNVNNLL